MFQYQGQHYFHQMFLTWSSRVLLQKLLIPLTDIVVNDWLTILMHFLLFVLFNFFVIVCIYSCRWRAFISNPKCIEIIFRNFRPATSLSYLIFAAMCCRISDCTMLYTYIPIAFTFQTQINTMVNGFFENPVRKIFYQWALHIFVTN